jgi:phosphoribosylglycinamide formyltransferase-1
VHVVRATVDDGPIVAQGAVPVLGGDTVDTLAARVLAVEHRLYPHALALIASGRARIDGERVIVDNAGAASDALLSPAP